MIIDSHFEGLADALEGLDIPEEIRGSLSLVNVTYLSFDNQLHQGQFVVHADLATEVQAIFGELCAHEFPIHKVIPIVRYGWNDDASMEDNNSSAFNYRNIIGTNRSSNHSSGRALDINPMQNPYYARDGKVYPRGARYDIAALGTITAHGVVVSVFKKYGWKWLGEREENQDYQHFEKIV